jgi:hypothetical protein
LFFRHFSLPEGLLVRGAWEEFQDQIMGIVRVVYWQTGMLAREKDDTRDGEGVLAKMSRYDKIGLGNEYISAVFNCLGFLYGVVLLLMVSRI